MIKIAIIGANGYTGYELLRLLAGHPKAKVTVATSRTYKGQSVASLYPSLQGFYPQLIFSDLNIDSISESCDAVFTALPHGLSAETGAKFIEKGKVVIDLSADFRYSSVSLFEKTYNITHPSPQLNKKAVYGLSELFFQDIKKASLIANPGCYTTAAILPLFPLITEGVIERDGIIIDAKSGVSGAGRQAKEALSFCETESNFMAYGVTTHRHTSEIEEKLGAKVIFTPHLLPIKRGILCTIYASLVKNQRAVAGAYKKHYQKSTFVKIVEELPAIKDVILSNECRIGYRICKKTNKIILISVLDNLIKGASGQAIQNMNIVFGLKQDMGLPKIGVHL